MLSFGKTIVTLCLCHPALSGKGLSATRMVTGVGSIEGKCGKPIEQLGMNAKEKSQRICGCFIDVTIQPVCG